MPNNLLRRSQRVRWRSRAEMRRAWSGGYPTCWIKSLRKKPTKEIARPGARDEFFWAREADSSVAIAFASAALGMTKCFWLDRLFSTLAGRLQCSSWLAVPHSGGPGLKHSRWRGSSGLPRLCLTDHPPWAWVWLPDREWRKCLRRPEPRNRRSCRPPARWA